MIAPCGIDCSRCDIHLASGNPEVAERLASAFRTRLDPSIQPSQFHCQGCPGDRVDHWSPNCRILRCCVDDKNLQHCNQCPDFACEKLEKWAAASKQHRAALERLRKMGDL